eukprot:NODE_196_length_15381_cov_0.267243.p7 type:complete len:171 gc:universal NODE_196_length_15381_cov_0.267243:2399-2911(+)
MLRGLFTKRMSSIKSVHDFTVKGIEGKPQSLSSYKGKALLIVNVASNCGYTKQYTGLQEIQEKYKGKLEVLGFPCNQFGGQEPGTNEEIQEFCTKKFSVTFPLYDKIDVNGPNTDPLYKYLKSEKSGLITDDIKWNFSKFLIDKNGKPVKRYGSGTEPKDIQKDIDGLLK